MQPRVKPLTESNSILKTRAFNLFKHVNVPTSLTGITQHGDEQPAERGGLTSADTGAIWRATRSLYRTGMNPAISLCLRRRGEVIMDRSIGYRTTHSTELFTPKTPVCLFSASKAVTAMLVHHLAETGQIDLHDPIARYIPEYARNGKGRTSIVHLLNHRAGLPRIREEVDPEVLFDTDRVKQLLYDAEPESPSGITQAYHAITGGYVLGELIERVTGETLNAVLDRVIRQPMGMEYFTYGIAENIDVAENSVMGMKLMPPMTQFIKHAVGGSIEQVVEVSNDPRFRAAVIPAGNLYATAEEGSRFFQMLLDGGRYQDKQIFHPDTVKNAIRGASRRPLFDRSLMIPLRFSAGMMRGNPGMSVFGPGAPKAFGHLGFVTILCWADPQRELSGALLTTGKGLIGTHMPRLLRLQQIINQRCI
jgi:CubicO group peptidase (beta-lactamase class C family)